MDVLTRKCLYSVDMIRLFQYANALSTFLQLERQLTLREEKVREKSSSAFNRLASAP